MSVVVVIPARYGSTRFSGKPLAPLLGRPLIQWVYEQAKRAAGVDRVVVATDDERIRTAVVKFGGEAMLTPAEARTGSDRLAAIAAAIESEYYLNLQGDEIIRAPQMLEELIGAFAQSQPLEMATLKRAIQDPTELLDPNVVKVVTDRFDDALYFSRAPIPHRRDGEPGPDRLLPPGLYFKHLGLYIFERAALLEFGRLPSGLLEEAEKLEQLRALEQGFRIKVWETRHESIRIDTPDDLARAERLLGRG
jgi:3-deoxy-manno-octulosonate cytidylyltransferase (CMP-KDO synthetase)